MSGDEVSDRLAHAKPAQTVESRRALDRFRRQVLGTAEVVPRLGRYEIREQLGQGGEGLVYEAYDPRLERLVALKIPVQGDGPQSESKARLLREAKALARVRHPNVVAVHDAGVSGDDDWLPGAVFLVMERVRGESLARWLTRPSRGWEQRLAPFLAVGRGLAAIHREGLIHRDVKPANVLMSEDGRVLVIDLGLAANSEGAGPEWLSRDAAGTPWYMAPEQLRGDPPSPRSDQYGMCQSAMEALRGQMLFEAKDLRQLLVAKGRLGREPPEAPRGVPPRLWAVLRRGCQPRPEDRYESVDALCAELERVLAARRRRRRWGAGLAVAAATVGAGYGVQSWRHARCERPSAEHTARMERVRRGFPPSEGRARAILERYAERGGSLEAERCHAEVEGQAEYARRLEPCIVEFRSVMDVILESLEAGVRPENTTFILGLTGLEPPAECRWRVERRATELSEVEHEEGLEVARLLGEVTGLTALDRVGEADQRLQSKLAGLRTDRGRAQLQLRAAQRLTRTGDPESGRALTYEAIEIAESVGDHETATRAEIELVLAHSLLEDFELAAAAARRARARMVHHPLGLYDRANLAYSEAAMWLSQSNGAAGMRPALEAFGWALLAFGPEHPMMSSYLYALAAAARLNEQYALAESALTQGFALTERGYGAGTKYSIRFLAQLGSVAAARGHLSDSLAWLEQALVRHRREPMAGYAYESRGQLLLTRAWTLRERGDYEDAIQSYRRSAEVRAQWRGDTIGVAESHLLGAESLMLAGRIAEAEAEAAAGLRALDGAGASPELPQRDLVAVLDAELAVERGEYELARSELERLSSTASDHLRQLGIEGSVVVYWARALSGLGRDAEAIQRLESLLRDRAPDVQNPLELLPAELALAKAVASDDPSRARRLCERIVRVYGPEAPRHPVRRQAQALLDQLTRTSVSRRGG